MLDDDLLTLRISHGDAQFQSFELFLGGKLLIGRADSAHYSLKSTALSREHLELVWNGDFIKIRDLGSTNKSYLKNADENSFQEIESYSIPLTQKKQQLMLGDLLFTLEWSLGALSFEGVQTPLAEEKLASQAKAHEEVPVVPEPQRTPEPMPLKALEKAKIPWAFFLTGLSFLGIFSFCYRFFFLPREIQHFWDKYFFNFDQFHLFFTGAFIFLFVFLFVSFWRRKIDLLKILFLSFLCLLVSALIYVLSAKTIFSNNFPKDYLALKKDWFEVTQIKNLAEQKLKLDSLSEEYTSHPEFHLLYLNILEEAVRGNCSQGELSPEDLSLCQYLSFDASLQSYLKFRPIFFKSLSQQRILLKAMIFFQKNENSLNENIELLKEKILLSLKEVSLDVEATELRKMSSEDLKKKKLELEESLYEEYDSNGLLKQFNIDLLPNTFEF